MDNYLGIASLAISVGGLVPVFFLRDRRKEVSLAVVVAAMVCLSASLVYEQASHVRSVDKVSADVREQLRPDIQTFDQLYESLHYVEFALLNESLQRLVDSGVVDHRVLKLRGDDGRDYRVKGYFVP